MTTVHQVLSNQTVRDAVEAQLRPNGLVFAKPGDRVGAVARALSSSPVSAVPLLSEKRRCVGLVAFSEMASHVLRKCGGDLEVLKDENRFWGGPHDAPIESLCEPSPEASIPTLVPLDASLRRVAEMFAQTGARRFGVVNDKEELVALISPSRLVAHVVSKLTGVRDPVLARRVADFPSPPPKGGVVSVTKTTPFLSAVNLMISTNHSTVAVVEDGAAKAVAGSLSLSDLKLVFRTKDFDLLKLHVWGFIQHARSLLDTEQYPFFSVSSESSLRVVISKLLATQVHHVYVVDPHEGTSSLVLGFNDVIRAMLQT